MHKQLIVPRKCHGLRLDVVLAQLLPQFSRSQLSTWLKEGAITCNQKSAKPKEKVYGGETIELLFEEIPALSTERHQPEAIPLNVVYEDEQLLVINKPAQLVVHPGAGNPEHTLVNAILHHFPPAERLPRAGIIHRLDKDTTGLLVIAKTLETHTYLIRQMQAREIQRHYVTLVHGHLIAGGEVNTFFGRHPKNRLKMAVRPQGKEAITRYAIRKQYSCFTLLDIQLLTGRTHQIRVHMQHIHHPVVGDPLYGTRMRFPSQASEDLKNLLIGFQRQALHACTLSFIHPLTQQVLTFEASLPDDFKALLTALDEYIV